MIDEEEVDIPYLWLSDEEWNKLMFHVRTQVNAIQKPLRVYGQDVYVDGATEELMKLFDLFSQYIRGKDVPLIVRNKPNQSPLE